ncbi:MAG: hypothetical protein ABJA50_14335 [Chloroflexota bacterium]
MLENSEKQPNGNIVACFDVVDGVSYKPQTLGEVGLDRIIGRSVTEWSANLGSYGMGGPGFFGLRLSAAREYPEEWLVLRVWGACCWLLLDGKWIEAHPNQYHVQVPLYSNFGPGEDWDHVSDKLVGTTLQNALVEPDASVFYLAGAEVHKLELPNDPSLLSLSGGTMQPREWLPGESQLDAWIIAHGDLWV